MKKKVLAAILIVTMAFGLVACGQAKGACEACGQEKPLYELTSEVHLGGYSSATYKLCKDCADATIELQKQTARNHSAQYDYTLKKIKK